MKITLLNSSILTSFGTYDFSPISLYEARSLVNENETVSAIGHGSTAEILSELLRMPVAANRTEFVQKVGETALIFKLKSRAPEGRILNRNEIEMIGYDFGLLIRTK